MIQRKKSLESYRAIIVRRIVHRAAFGASRFLRHVMVASYV
jgi:hypothetical protein